MSDELPIDLVALRMWVKFYPKVLACAALSRYYMLKGAILAFNWGLNGKRLLTCYQNTGFMDFFMEKNVNKKDNKRIAN